MATVFVKREAVGSTVANGSGGIFQLKTPFEEWDANDQVVKHNPTLFTDEAPEVRTSQGWVRRSSRGVEKATAKPGQKRKR